MNSSQSRKTTTSVPFIHLRRFFLLQCNTVQYKVLGPFCMYVTLRSDIAQPDTAQVENEIGSGKLKYVLLLLQTRITNVL
jgi:hypothetical protein